MYFLARLIKRNAQNLSGFTTRVNLGILRHPSPLTRTYATSSPVPPKLIANIQKEKKPSLLESAVAYIQADKPESAIEIIKKITEDNPQYKRAQYLLANVFTNLKRYSEALAVISALLKKEPNNINYKISYGQALVLLGKLEEAKHFFKQLKLELIQNITFNLVLKQQISEQTKNSLNAISQDKIPEKYNKLVEDFVVKIANLNEAFLSESDKFRLLAIIRENANEMVKDKIINDVLSAIPHDIKGRYDLVNSLLVEVYGEIIEGIKKNIEQSKAPVPDNSNKHTPGNGVKS